MSPGRRTLALAALLLAPAFLRLIAIGVDAAANRTVGRTASVPAPAGAAYADLHADPLLWDRDLLQRHRRGHADLPRLLAGGTAVQVFAVVTQAPFGINIERNPDAAPDLISALQLAQLKPPRTWFDRRARALDRARDLERAAARSGGQLVVIRDRAALGALLKERSSGKTVVAGVLALEGGGGFEDGPEGIRALHAAGFRMASLAHFSDTALGGSAHGQSKGGLTPRGRETLAEMARLGMILDLAHASPALYDEALATWKGPVVVSHGGAKGTCDNPRNLSDAQLRALAARGGLIGIGFWPTATCGTDLASIARAIAYAVSVAGKDVVALGSDFDGSVTTPLDAAGLPALAAELARAGLTPAAVEAVMGGNARRFLLASLPPGP